MLWARVRLSHQQCHSQQNPLLLSISLSRAVVVVVVQMRTQMLAVVVRAGIVPRQVSRLLSLTHSLSLLAVVVRVVERLEQTVQTLYFLLSHQRAVVAESPPTRQMVLLVALAVAVRMQQELVVQQVLVDKVTLGVTVVPLTLTLLAAAVARALLALQIIRVLAAQERHHPLRGHQ